MCLIMVLYCDVDIEVPIILGRSFLSPRNVLVDVEPGELKVRVSNHEVMFNVCKPMKPPGMCMVVSVQKSVDELIKGPCEKEVQ